MIDDESSSHQKQDEYESDYFEENSNSVSHLDDVRAQVKNQVGWNTFCEAYRIIQVCFDSFVTFLTYGVCAWSGFFSVELIGRIDAFLRRMFKYAFCKHLITLRNISAARRATFLLEPIFPNIERLHFLEMLHFQVVER